MTLKKQTIKSNTVSKKKKPTMTSKSVSNTTKKTLIKKNKGNTKVKPTKSELLKKYMQLYFKQNIEAFHLYNNRGNKVSAIAPNGKTYILSYKTTLKK